MLFNLMNNFWTCACLSAKSPNTTNNILEQSLRKFFVATFWGRSKGMWKAWNLNFWCKVTEKNVRRIGKKSSREILIEKQLQETLNAKLESCYRDHEFCRRVSVEIQFLSRISKDFSPRTQKQESQKTQTLSPFREGQKIQFSTRHS